MKIYVNDIEFQTDHLSEIRVVTVSRPPESEPEPKPEPETLAIDWEYGPGHGTNVSNADEIVLSFTGRGLKNVELVQAGQWKGLARGIVVAEGNRGTLSVPVKDLPPGEVSFELLGYDKPAGESGFVAVRSTPRSWITRPPVIGGGQGGEAPSVTRETATAPTFIPPKTGPGGMTRRIFDDMADGPDLSIWRKRLTWDEIKLNQELQCYSFPGQGGRNGTKATYDPFSAAQRHGKAWTAITARRTPADEADRAWGMKYQSGVIAGYAAANQLYGYFEVEACLPDVSGMWPAFWMANGDGPGGRADQWPPEIDWLEWPFNRAKQATEAAYHRIWTNQHWKTSAGRKSTGGWVERPGLDVRKPVVYGGLWLPKIIAYYVDGHLIRSKPNEGLHLPMHPILNLAVGDWAGPPEDAKLPAEFLVRDYGQWDFAA